MKHFSITASLFIALTAGQAGLAQSATISQCLHDIGAAVWVNGVEFVMGDDSLYPEEGPAHKVSVDGFWIDAHEVTNEQFASFVLHTGYVTVAERSPDPEDWPSDAPKALLTPGSIVFTIPESGQDVARLWSWVSGTHWRHPNGPESDIEEKGRYPVTHVAYEDAQAYASWAGRSLPTEAQFELAARSRRNTRFPWNGNQLAPHGQHHANTWQGTFPTQDKAEDGHQGLAPVGCFGANDYGAYDLIGNVWEWTSNWYTPRHNPLDTKNPTGPTVQLSHGFAADGAPIKVIKGGSYLCSENYCLRFRPAARQAQDTGLGTSHIGFRTVKN